MRFLFSIVFFAWFLAQWAQEDAAQKQTTVTADKRASPPWADRLKRAKTALSETLLAVKTRWHAARKRLATYWFKRA